MDDTESRQRTAKLRWSITLLLISGIAVWWMFQYYHRLPGANVLDQGTRGLIVISTNDIPKMGYTINTTIDISGNGDTGLTVWATADNKNYDRNTDDYRQFSFQITFAGLGPVIKCGDPATALKPAPYPKLSPGTRQALLIDQLGGRSSAINYSATASDTVTAAENKLANTNYPTISGQMVLDNTGAHQGRYTPAVDDQQKLIPHLLYAEQCLIPQARLTTTDNTGQRTVLPPQIDRIATNWTAQANGNPNNHLFNTIWIDRTPGWTLSESYPQPTVFDTYFRYHSAVYLTDGNLLYTDQPVWVFTNRISQHTEPVILMILGALTGITGTLLVNCLSQSLDLWHNRKRRKQQT